MTRYRGLPDPKKPRRKTGTQYIPPMAKAQGESSRAYSQKRRKPPKPKPPKKKGRVAPKVAKYSMAALIKAKALGKLRYKR